MKKTYQSVYHMRCHLVGQILEFVILHADIIAKDTKDNEPGMIFNSIIEKLIDLDYVNSAIVKQSSDMLIQATEVTMDNWDKGILTDIVTAIVIKGMKFINKPYGDNLVQEIADLDDFIYLVHTFIDCHWATDDDKSSVHAKLTKIIVKFGYPQTIRQH